MLFTFICKSSHCRSSVLGLLIEIALLTRRRRRRTQMLNEKTFALELVCVCVFGQTKRTAVIDRDFLSTHEQTPTNKMLHSGTQPSVLGLIAQLVRAWC